ncbi:MAG TPA: hypothetical protein VM260_19245, partial [Pirellula sp.]|nr:hypothetical protein [Pirellula sp.]
MQCPNCEGFGCGYCVHGTIEIKGCPNEYCREVACVIPMIDLFEKGLPPVNGGVLDQSAWFVDAVRLLANE